jgi:PAS domain S-box-containing protein
MIERSGFSSDTTQQKQADGELLRQKTYLDELFELAPDAVVLTTLRNPRILRINREFTRMFGYTSEEAVGKCHRDLVTPDGLEPILPEDPDLVAGRKVEWEVIRRRKDGTRFHAHITGKRIQLSDDDDAAYLIFRDISTRKHAEAMFAGEKRLLEIIAAGAPLSTTLDALCRLAEDVDRSSLVSILLLDRNGRQVRHGAGPSLPSTYVDALDGRPVGLGFGPCGAAAHLGERVISADIAADKRWADEYRALALAHGLRACWSTPIKSSVGRVLGTFAIYPSEQVRPTHEEASRIEQLTHLASIAIERAESIEALHQSEKRYERAMLAAEAGFWDWDVPADEFYVSPKLREMADVPPGTEFAGRADFMARAPFHPDDQAKWERAVMELFASGGTRLAMEIRSIHGGETRWVLLSGMCMRDPFGKILRWTGSATDVTARKRAEGLLAAEKHLLEMMARAAPLSAILDALCRIIEESLAGCLCGISLVDATGTRLMNGAAPTLPRGYVQAIDDKAMDRDAGPCCMAALMSEQVISVDIATETRWVEQGWCALTLSHRLRSIWTTPIVSSAKRALGTFAVYFTHPSSPTDEYLAVIERFTHVAAVAIERSHADEALRRSEAALRVSEERYALALEASEEGHYDIDLQTGEIFVSARVNEIYGFPAQAETLKRGEFFARIPFHPDDRPRVLAEVSKPDWNDRNLHEIQCQIVPRPGETRWTRSRAKVVRDAQGRAVRRVGVLADITERKRAEEALRAQTERLQLGQAAMRMIIMDWNIVEDRLTWSDSPEWLRGPMPASGRYPLFKDQVHPEDRDSFLATRSRALETLQVQTTEFRLVRTDGEVIWVLERKHAFAGADGKPVRILAAMFDITERKRAEDELRESEARFRALTALWSDWYWRQDEHLRFTYSSATGNWPDGSPRSSAIGMTRWEIPGIVPLSSSWAEHRALLAARKPFRDFEYCRLSGDGTRRYVSSSGTPIFDDKGEFRGYQGVARDITERKRVDEELRSRQAMLDLAQKAARTVAFEWRVDAGNGERGWSPDLEAMYGIPAGSYDGTYESWKKLVHPEDWANVRAAIKAAQQTGDVDAEYRVIHRDSAIRWLQAKGRMLFDPEGKPTRVVGFMLDVTDRHIAAEELQRMERQLRQAQRLEALGTLAGGIAHDFNNLLGAILGYGEMALRNVRAGSRLRRDIESIMIAGERGHALVERILAFSRSGVGERVAVHVEKVARETLALFAAKLPRRVVIERRLHAGSAAVMGDPTQIHQVLMNLLTNAVQAMPSGGTLCVSLDRIHFQVPRVVTTGSITAREYVVMEVSDSGSGIPAEIFEKIFDPFFTTKEVGVGTGLGLSLVHGIVTGLGGAIDIATTVGKGSVFKVYLPLADDVAVPSKPRKRLERKTARTGRGRVMVIDDEEALVRLATETLTESGYSAVGFTSSAKAIEAFLAHPEQFDVVITDESMPGASGSDLVRKMRALRPTLPILLVSGYLSAAVIERARKAGATEVLKKPLRARQLQIALERLLLPTRRPSKNDLAPSELSKPAAKSRRRVSASKPQSGSARR